MIPFICDNPDRIAARVYATVRYVFNEDARHPDPPADCACCSFWRGAFVMGVICAALFTAYLWFQ